MVKDVIGINCQMPEHQPRRAGWMGEAGGREGVMRGVPGGVEVPGGVGGGALKEQSNSLTLNKPPTGVCLLIINCF